MSPLWRWDELCHALALVGEAAPVGPDIGGVSIDSRTLLPGSLFIALDGSSGPVLTAGRGAGHDGHDFVAAAAAKGAVAALVHKELTERSAINIPLLRVKDTRESLWQLGEAARRRLSGVVFAVTGSAGKTTAKGWLAQVTTGCASSGSLNNLWGVPLSLALTPRDAPAGIFEIGMNAPGEIAPLARLVRPQVALVLNALPVHLQGLGSVEAVRMEKLSIVRGLQAGGTLVLPADMQANDIPDGASGVAGARRLTFGRSPRADVRFTPMNGDWQRIRLNAAGETLSVCVPGGGAHRAATVAGVAAAALAGGFPLRCMQRLTGAEVPAGRGRVTEVAGVTIIDDSYNANPVSMAHAIEQLASRSGRRIALLGDMLELGSAERQAHIELARMAATLDAVWCVGSLSRDTCEHLPKSVARGWFADAGKALLDDVCTYLRAGDALLVKGSNRIFWSRGLVDALIARLAKERGA